MGAIIGRIAVQVLGYLAIYQAVEVIEPKTVLLVTVGGLCLVMSQYIQD